MKTKKQLTSFIFVSLLIVLTVIFGGWIANKSDVSKPDYYYKVNANLEKFTKVYEEITKKYIEDVDPDEFIDAGIYGMLNTLDPYTMYIEKEGNSELKIMTRGKYGGVGMRISKRDSWPTVVEPPFSGTPSAKAGIREGDRIIEVDSVVTKDLSISETAGHLRGKPGTAVNIKISRIGVEDNLEFRLIRAEIKVEEITYSGLIDDKIGLIRLAHFSRNVGAQIQREILELKKQGMEKLILDLRGNPGGLLESAVNVADNFIEDGKTVVYTKGKFSNSNRNYTARKNPVWGSEPLIVLVDTSSASASEIVAGAIQDLDRGLIVGSPTFGKGLVQTVIPINSESALKVTTAKYYIPSGRLIQKPNYFKNEKVLMSSWNDDYDSTAVFKTASGRVVQERGGIYPDIRVKRKKIPMIGIQMIMQSMFFNFSLEYTADNPELEKGFEVDSKMLAEFKAFLKEKDFKYKTREDAQLKKMKKLAKENEFEEEAESAFASLQEIFDKKKEKDYEEGLEFIKLYIKAEIAAKLWGSAAKVEVKLDSSPAIQKALEIFSNDEQYYAVLNDKK